MRRVILFFAVILVGTRLIYAGNNENFFNISAGYMFPKACSATLAFEHEYLYQHGIEFFAQYVNDYNSSKFNAYHQMTGGIAYKYPLVRSKNSMLRLRGGIECGSDWNKFLYGAELGFEYAFCVNVKLQVVIQQRNEYNFGASRKFHSGINIGFRIPL